MRCFDSLTPKPKGGALSQAAVVKLIARLKSSEQAKSLCGKRLIAFYEAQQG